MVMMQKPLVSSAQSLLTFVILQVGRLPKTTASDPTGSKSRGCKKVNACMLRI